MTDSNFEGGSQKADVTDGADGADGGYNHHGNNMATGGDST